MKEKVYRRSLAGLVGLMFLGIMALPIQTKIQTDQREQERKELEEEIWRTELKYAPYIMLDNYETVRNPEFPRDSTDSLAYFHYP